MSRELLVVVLMVKNEANAIENTLLPFVKGGVTNICVFDTGSTDTTIEITRAFFKSHHINGFIDEEPFVDFSTSRNRALEHAEKHFPNTIFFIMPDADWYIQNVSKLLEYCETEKEKQDPLYNIKVHLNETEYRSARLFRVSARNRYRGVIHEAPDLLAFKSVYEDVYFVHSLNPVNQRQSAARYSRDIELLLKNLELNPSNPRDLFYLAQTYQCMGDLQNAYKYYLKRSCVEGFPEEDSINYYRLGVIAENLCKTDNNITWETALNYYLQAFELRPTRIESLIKIAYHYLKSKPKVSYMYAQYACSVSYPLNDVLQVQKYVYHYSRYEIVSLTALEIGDYEIGKIATETALRVQPNNENLKMRLLMYQAKINGMQTDIPTSIPYPRTEQQMSM